MIDTNHSDYFDGLSAIDAERRARSLRAQATIRLFSGLWNAVGRAINGVRDTMQRRRMVSELSQLDDRLLADVGLRRESLNADLMKGQRDAPAYHGPAITSTSLNVTPQDQPMPANTDNGGHRQVA
jgi:uncharacterized protein YjiS (DUF1127 family)